MKLLLTLTTLSLAACSSATERQHNRLMQKIEEQVQLPKGAKRLEQYARYYAIDGNRVVARYITIVEPDNQYYNLPVGSQRWLYDHRNLPSISDGGCAIVNVSSDTKVAGLPRAFCNGEA